MVLEYFTAKKAHRDGAASKSQDGNVDKTPILNDEEERFLERIASEGTSPYLAGQSLSPTQASHTKGKDAQMALMDGAHEIPLPVSPLKEPESKNEPPQSPTKHHLLQEKGQKYWSNISSIVRRKSKSKGKEKEGEPTDPKTQKEEEEEIHPKNGGKDEERQEEDDLTQVLDQLNLAAVNNRVFSFSKESQELLDKFKLVLKDLINGVPTAYDDLEKLLTNSEGQIQRLYGGLPPFLQTLIKGLPSKMSAALGPEILAAAAEKPNVGTANLDPTSPRTRARVPSLKRLVSEQGAIASMLRSILHFLKLRFPAFITGTNVLMSLAVFLLLFVLWYCHKRGKETRLSRERLSAEISDSDLEKSQTEESQLGNSQIPEASAQLDTSREIGSTGPISSEANEGIDLPSVLDLPSPASVPLPTEESMTEDRKKS